MDIKIKQLRPDWYQARAMYQGKKIFGYGAYKEDAMIELQKDARKYHGKQRICIECETAYNDLSVFYAVFKIDISHVCENCRDKKLGLKI